MRFDITLTWSKVIALLVLVSSVLLDVINGDGATAFMFALPFIVVLVTGKQYLDSKK